MRWLARVGAGVAIWRQKPIGQVSVGHPKQEHNPVRDEHCGEQALGDLPWHMGTGFTVVGLLFKVLLTEVELPEPGKVQFRLKRNVGLRMSRQLITPLLLSQCFRRYLDSSRPSSVPYSSCVAGSVQPPRAEGFDQPVSLNAQ